MISTFRLRYPHSRQLASIIVGGLTFCAALASAQETARLAGTVRNALTGTFLNGATVEVSGTTRTATSDTLGRFDFAGLPAGSYTVVVNYTGLDTAQQTVRLTAGATSYLEVLLKSEIYQMETFQVTAEASGHAAAITRQKNATNLLSAAATDAFGSLANQNPGEVFMRLPGVSATVTEDNEISGVAVRGMAGYLNAVTMDGGILAPVASNATRQVRFTTNVSEQFEEFEVVKGLTPEMDGSSLGGSVNMKTKSPLSSTRGNEIRYRLGARWAPPFVPHNPLRRERPIQPDLSLSYQGVFDVLGGRRNLGVSLNAIYFESVGDYVRTVRDYQSTLASSAYIWDYQPTDYYFNRHLETLSGRVDFQWNEFTRLSLRGTVNDYTAFGGHIVNTSRVYTGQTIATLDASGNPTGTGAVLPNFTELRTEARALSTSGYQMITNSVGQMQRQRTLQFVGEHKRDRLQFEVNANLATGVLDQTSGQDTKNKAGGNFTSTITGVGWVLDSSQSREFPRFVQTGGPSIYDVNNYRNSIITLLGNSRDAHVYAGRADLRYELPLGLPVYLKTGLSFRRQDSIAKTWNNTRFTYAGPDRVVGTVDDTLAPFLDTQLQRSGEFGSLSQAPFVHVGTIGQNLKDHPELWVEDVYYREGQKYVGTSRISEDVPAGYLMGSVRLGRFNVLGGVRQERTEVSSGGWVIARSLATIADPVARAASEYGYRKYEASYTNTLPSFHLTYQIAPRLIARSSFSTSIGRPQYTNLVPSETVNDTARTVSTRNMGIKPQTADNWDLSVEYYLKQMGMISAGFFQKDLENFIYTYGGDVVAPGPNNGFNGNYVGYAITTQRNGGSARVRGIELSYQQQLGFGPKWVRSLGVFGNYTRLTTKGDYGTGTQQSVSSLAEFVPETWNAGARWSRGAFRTNLLVNHTGEYLFTYSATPARLLYKRAFRNTTLNLSYALRPTLDVYCDAYNLFSKPQSYYYGVASHLQNYSRKGTILSFGVRGKF